MLSEAQREAAKRIFAAHGYTDALRVAQVRSEDERVFLIPATALSQLPEGALAAELQTALGRKVWVVADDGTWGPPDALH